MAEYPSLPLWTDAYIADTAHLTNEEHGVYLRLLMFAWRSPTCSLPDDDRRLALMVGVTPKKWASLRAVIAQFWLIEDGRWTQKRLTAEREKVQGRSEKAEAAAEARWRLKELKNQGKEDANASSEDTSKDMLQACPPSPSPIDRVGEGSARAREHTPAREAGPPISVPPTILPDDAWRLYELVVEAVGHRKSDVLPSRWMPPTAVIECSRFRGFGLNDDEIVAVAKGSRASFPDPPDGPKALERAMRNFAAAKAAPQLTPPTPTAITALNAGGFRDRQEQLRDQEADRTRRIISAAARGST